MGDIEKSLTDRIKSLLFEARKAVAKSVNTTMVYTYYEIGRLIIEDEQDGKTRAKYGKGVLKKLSNELTKEFGEGFSVQNLERMRFFYSVYSNSSTVLRNSQEENIHTISKNINLPKFTLSWSHYVFLVKLNEVERAIQIYSSNSFNQFRYQLV